MSIVPKTSCAALGHGGLLLLLILRRIVFELACFYSTRCTLRDSSVLYVADGTLVVRIGAAVLEELFDCGIAIQPVWE
jgi:hypothetical protein